MFSVVTKATGIASPLEIDIHRTYFPSEDENSGIIVFKSNSRRAVLKISFAKVCFSVTMMIEIKHHFHHSSRI